METPMMPQDDCEYPEMPIDMRLAAIVHLLSSSVLRGTTASKTAALQAHLGAAVVASDQLGPCLQNAIEDALANWQDVHCHPNSIPVDYFPFAASGSALQ
jgi:hypothetical protein